MKKPIKIIIAIAAVLVIAGAAVCEITFALRLKNKNGELSEKVAELQTQLDKANEAIDKLKDKADEALSEKTLVNKLKKSLGEYMWYDEEMFEGIDTIDGLFSALFEYEWQGEIHEIWDDTAVVEAYKSGSADGLSEEDVFVLETASAIIDEIITEGMTDYEKELAVYNWQVKYVRYDEGHFSPIPDEDVDQYNYYPYGVLKYHSAICVGNATTFKLFMDMLDIDCMIIHSTTEGEHAWNLICLDDEWYHVDVTFDGGYDEPDYAYFNVPDGFKLDGGYPWDTDEFPAAEGYKYCYCYNEAVDVAGKDEAVQLIKDMIDNEGSDIIFKCADRINGLERLVDKLSEELPDNVWLWLDTDGVYAGDSYIYRIKAERDMMYEDDDDLMDIIGSIIR